MDISDVRVKLVRDPGERLKAVCTVTFDESFVIRDVKVVEGTNGLFVAMPSQKLSVHCPRCRSKNHLRAKFCNECGAKLPPNEAPSDANGRSRLHRDIAHPIKAAFRQVLQQRVIQAFNDEALRADAPDYEPADYDTDDQGESDDTRAAHDDRPADEDRPGDDDRAGDDDAPTTDYDDIIAELRGRPAARSAPGHESERDEPRRAASERPRDADQPRDGDRPRRRRRGRRDQRSGGETAPPPQRPDRGRETADRPAQREFAEAEEEPTPKEPEPQEQPAYAESKPQSRPEPKRGDDDLPFGHGIL